MDNLTKAQRHKNMQKIRSMDTISEKRIMQELKRRKIYFAKYVLSLPGKPDIVFRRKKIAVFIDSDFWHVHPKRFIMPKSNIKYWKEKIVRNQKRDSEVNHRLRKEGWKIIRIWEHDLKKNLSRCMDKILKSLK